MIHGRIRLFALSGGLVKWTSEGYALSFASATFDSIAVQKKSRFPVLTFAEGIKTAAVAQASTLCRSRVAMRNGLTIVCCGTGFQRVRRGVCTLDNAWKRGRSRRLEASATEWLLARPAAQAQFLPPVLDKSDLTVSRRSWR